MYSAILFHFFQCLCYTVALTQEFYTPKNYLGYFVAKNAFGMLTTSRAGELHRVGEIIDGTGQFAGVVCRRLGFEYGRTLSAPPIKLYDGSFSWIESRCGSRAGDDDLDLAKCSVIKSYPNETDMLVDVDYILCQDNEDASKNEVTQ